MSKSIFISWSGDRSKQIGLAMKDCIEELFSDVSCFLSKNDIEKGSMHFIEIRKELKSSDIGLFCLTKDNLYSPWIYFEAGAISKNYNKSQIFPFLCGVQKSELMLPLQNFQATVWNDMQDVKSMMNSIRINCRSNLPETQLLAGFERVWLKNYYERVDKATR